MQKILGSSSIMCVLCAYYLRIMCVLSAYYVRIMCVLSAYYLRIMCVLSAYYVRIMCVLSAYYVRISAWKFGDNLYNVGRSVWKNIQIIANTIGSVKCRFIDIGLIKHLEIKNYYKLTAIFHDEYNLITWQWSPIDWKHKNFMYIYLHI